MPASSAADQTGSYRGLKIGSAPVVSGMPLMTAPRNPSEAARMISAAARSGSSIRTSASPTRRSGAKAQKSASQSL